MNGINLLLELIINFKNPWRWTDTWQLQG